VATHPLTLADLRARLDPEDGCLPNGRAAGVNDSDWSRFLAALRDTGWKVLSGLNDDRPFPKTMENLLADEATENVTLRIEAGPDVHVNVFPNWGLDIIWFDFDVRELKSQDDADSLHAFVRLLGRSVDKPVVLSYEGDDDMPFVRYEPARDTYMWLSPPRT
jgi:hypothetical protein